MRLYHASMISGLKILKPNPHRVVNGESVVFASIDPKFALAMTYGSKNTIAVCYALDKKTGKKEIYVDEIKPNTLNMLKNKASLYVLENKNFEHDERLKKEEFISRREAKVIKEIKIRNVLKRLKDMGTRIIQYEEVPKSLKIGGKDPDNSFKECQTDSEK